jgi:hypothetical protein
MTEQDKGITQPIEINITKPEKAPDEGTQPVTITNVALRSELPEWILKFASTPEQSTGEFEPEDKTEQLETYSDNLEDDEAFTPPSLPVEAEWQELSDFQEQEALDHETAQEAWEIQSEEHLTEAEAGFPEAVLLEDVEETPTPDPRAEAVESFKQDVRDMLILGQREKAFALIRDNKDDPILLEAAKKTLRSQLTLASDTGSLWDFYEELNS